MSNIASLARRTSVLLLTFQICGTLSAHDALSVATYGAVGDGVADDTTAIQNTINAAAAAGKSAYLPGGNYLITSRLNLGSTTLTGEGVTVEGGMQRSLLVAGTQGMTMLYCTAKSRVD